MIVEKQSTYCAAVEIGLSPTGGATFFLDEDEELGS